MLDIRRLRIGGGSAAALLIAVALSGPLATTAAAAGPPIIGDVWATSVFANSAKLNAELDANELPTGYHIDYIPKATYDANVAEAKDPFAGTKRIPVSTDASIGLQVVTVVQQVFGLAPDTTYRYRVVASNSPPIGGKTTSATFTLATQPLGVGDELPDARVWEMVSPIDKNGGQIDPPGTLAGGGVLQAAAGGGAITYSSGASFGAGAQGAAPASQYVSARDANGNWVTENITAPLFAGSYGLGNEGVPYRLFSEDLSRGIMLNGRHCRGEGSDCPVSNQPLAGTDAPEGYQNYYLRESAIGSFRALLGAANVDDLAIEPADFAISFVGASADLRHGVLSTCAALTPNATQVPSGSGCDLTQPNLYLYSPTAGLTLVNLLPAQAQGTPGAQLAAQSGAVSLDGSRVFWRDLASGALYLREGAQTKLVDAAGTFQTATGDGSTAFFTKAGHLYRYQAPAGTVSDLTPSGGVEGVLGVSADGNSVYYVTGSGVFLRKGLGATTPVAADADPTTYPPTTGTARISADGTRLLFTSTTPLTGRDTKTLAGGVPTSQVYLYDDSGAGSLRCVSCNPTFGRPLGGSSIPGAVANGEGPTATQAYKPRVLAADGRRVYFESADALVGTDTNGAVDVYQWEANGIGSCTRPEGCVALISSGRNEDGATLVDASADGFDVYFLIEQALSVNDLPGSIDLYDARINGRLAEKSTEIICIADACQPPPEEAVDPPLGTQRKGPGNPGVNFQVRKCRKGLVKHRGKCVSKKAKKRDEKRKHHKRKDSRRAGR
jgi:hypothetical protein